MKKKNWLMTIAFAVLALTIVSTCVIGSTYAKYTSTVGGTSAAQAAGFLVTGGEVSRTDSGVLIAPEVTIEIGSSIDYFSQVQTTIAVTNAINTTANTGAFTTTNWGAIVTYFNDYIAADNDHKVDADLAVSDVITVSTAQQATVVQAIYDAGYSATESENKWAAAYTSGNVLPAMKATVNAPVHVVLDLDITWTTPMTSESTPAKNDAFDTFVGNVIAKIAQTNGTSLTTWEPVAGHAISLSWTTAYETSTVGTTLSITATQVTTQG